ncbi:MAG: hypothetical protein HY303_07830 [Candidatus Wallbacteria bacterium]|nr:hypothetical protein [Candidatus Wallbacteria bacterium]
MALCGATSIGEPIELLGPPLPGVVVPTAYSQEPAAQSPTRRLALAAAAVPPLVLAVLIACHAVNVPWWDQWDFVGVLARARDGTLGLTDLWKLHNEHRVLLPRLLMLGSALLTSWDVRFELAVSYAMAWAVFLLLLRLAAGDGAPDSPGSSPLVTVAISAAVFSPSQFENWLWGWQLALFLSNLCLAGAVWCLVSGPPDCRRRYWAALVAALAGTCTMASGLFIWPAGALLLAWRTGRSRRLLGWLGTGACALLAYAWGPDASAHAPHWRMALYYPAEYVRYVLAFLGGFFLVTPPLAVFLGIVECAALAGGLAYVALREPRLMPQCRAWCAVALYVLAIAAGSGLGRLSSGYEQATAGRYPTFSMLFLVSAIAVAAVAFSIQSAPRRRWPRVGALLVLAAGLACAHVRGAGEMAALGGRLERVRLCVHDLEKADLFCLTEAHPDVTVVVSGVRYLRSIHYGGF